MNTVFIDAFLASDAGRPFAGIRQDAKDILTAFLDVGERGPGDLDSASVEAALVSVVPRMKKHRLSDGPALFATFIEYAGAKANLAGAGPLAEEARRRAAELAEEEGKKREPVRVEAPRAGRNDPCPCGSGKKFKRCCA